MVKFEKLFIMQIYNESPSLFGIALRNLLEEAAHENESSLVRVWFPHTTLATIKSWVEETGFPEPHDIHSCIIIAKVFLSKENSEIAPGVAIVAMDMISEQPEGQRKEAVNELIQYTQSIKDKAPARQKIAQ